MCAGFFQGGGGARVGEHFPLSKTCGKLALFYHFYPKIAETSPKWGINNRNRSGERSEPRNFLEYISARSKPIFWAYFSVFLGNWPNIQRWALFGVQFQGGGQTQIKGGNAPLAPPPCAHPCFILQALTELLTRSPSFRRRRSLASLSLRHFNDFNSLQQNNNYGSDNFSQRYSLWRIQFIAAK